MSKQLAVLLQPQVRLALLWYLSMVSLALCKYWGLI